MNFYTKIEALLTDHLPKGLVPVKQYTDKLKTNEGSPEEFGSDHYAHLPPGTLVGHFSGKAEDEFLDWAKSEKKYDTYEVVYHNASGYGSEGEYWLLPHGKSIPGSIPQGKKRAFTIKKV